MPTSSTATALLTAYFVILKLTQPFSALESSTPHTHNLDGNRQQREVVDAGLVTAFENFGRMKLGMGGVSSQEGSDKRHFRDQALACKSLE